MTYTKLALTISSYIIFGFTILSTIFLSIVIRPLYKFSKERTALYILFSKVFLNFRVHRLDSSFHTCFSLIHVGARCERFALKFGLALRFAFLIYLALYVLSS